MKNKYVVVTTEHKGVFAGMLVKNENNAVTIKDARMCVYWSSDVRGVVGLAASGPTRNCKVTPAAPSIELSGVTSIMECSDAAEKAWEEGPWA